MTLPTNVNKPFAVVLYITDQQGKILSTTRKNNHTSFGLVGGKVDKEDTCARKALDREVYEETGVDISTIPCDSRITLLDDNVPVEAFIFNKSYSSLFPRDRYEGPEKTYIDFIQPYILTFPSYSKFWKYNKELFNFLN